MNFVASTGSGIIVDLIRPAGRAVRKCICLNGEIKKMEAALEKIESRMTDVERDLIKSKTKPSEKVRRWTKSVKEVKKSVHNLTAEFRRNFQCRKKNECVGGCRNFWHGKEIRQQVDNKESKYVGVFPYVWHRYEISRQVDDWMSKIEHLEKTYDGFSSYGDRPFPEPLRRGLYTEEVFADDEMPEIHKLLDEKDIQVIGVRSIHGERTTSFLKLVYNSDHVRCHFDECFIQASSLSPDYMETARLIIGKKFGLDLPDSIEAAREKIGKAVGLVPPVSSDNLSEHWRRTNFPFLLVLDGLEDGFSFENLTKMVADIGLPSLDGNRFKIVCNCRSEQMVYAMHAKDFDLGYLPRDASSLIANLDILWAKFYKTKDPSGVMYYFALILPFCFGCFLFFSFISWLFVMTLIYLMWWWSTSRKLSHGSTQGLHGLCSEVLEALSTWWGTFLQKGGDDCTTYFETRQQEPGSSSRSQEESDMLPESEIVPAED